MSFLDVAVTYQLENLRHLIVPQALLAKYRELDKRVKFPDGQEWVRIQYHGVENVIEALDVAFPPQSRGRRQDSRQ